MESHTGFHSLHEETTASLPLTFEFTAELSEDQSE